MTPPDVNSLDALVAQLSRELSNRSLELDTLLNALPVGVGIALDRECNDIRVNPAFAQMLGLPHTANASKTAPHQQQPATFRVLDGSGAEVAGNDLPMQIAAREGRTVDGVQLDVVRDDGRVIHLLEYAVPLLDDAQQPRGSVGIFVDISEQRRIAEEQSQVRERLLEHERASREEAERLGRMKDEFLLTLSHELRTPLNAILGWAHLLLRQKSGAADSTMVAQGLEVIERNARAQARLIEDLLDMTSIISNKVRLNVQRVDLAEVIRAAIDSVHPSAQLKNIRLQHTLDAKAGPVSGDPARLQQVFWNLLTNAVKFTDSGGRVHVVLERVNSHVEVSVSDTGQGIAPEFLGSVFERFRQGDSSTARKHGGLGLGLAIVKSLVELHGGSVRVKSAGLGHGATFIISLPVVAVHEEREDANAVRPGAYALLPEPDLHGVRALVVDDEGDAVALLERVLGARGARVLTARNVSQALQILTTQPIDIVVSDIGMPEQDGYELIRRVRALDGTMSIVPAIALTAYARADDRHLALLAGYQMHLAKPVSEPELVAGIASLLKVARR